MATLTGQQIDSSYQGLLKTLDNAAINGTNRVISDGVGNALPLEASTTTIKFTGNADFTAATVTGDNNTTYTIGSVQDGANADIKLTDNLGNESKATLVAGTNITLSNSGNDLTISAAGGSAGMTAGSGSNSVQSAVTGATGNASASNSIAIGNGASASGGTGAMAYGNDAVASSTHAAAFGQYAEATSSYAISFGRTSVASGDGSVAFGQQTSAAQAGAVAMGRQVTSDTADTTHVRALKIVAPDGGTGGNGITMLSPDGTAGVITLTNSSALAIDGTPIGGGGGSAGLESGSGADSMQSASSLTTGAANASGADSIALGDSAAAGGAGAIAIGNTTNSGSSSYTICIGNAASAFGGDAIVIGRSAYGGISGSRNIVIGRQASIASGVDSIALGKGASVTADNGHAIGENSSVTASGATAIGNLVTASTVDTVTMKLLQIANYATINFADDAAAATGGIPLGGVYHTAGALKIRIA